MILNLHKRSHQWLMLLILSFIWGASFILIKRGLRSFDLFQVASLRMLIAYLILLPFAIKRLHLLKKDKRLIWLFIEVGFIGNAIPSYFFTWAQQYIDSSFAGILNTTTPIFAFLFTVFWFKHKVDKTKWIGLIIGFIGVIGLLLAKGMDNFTSGNGIYALVIILASIFYGVNVNVIKEYLHDFDGLTMTSLAFFFVGPFVIIQLLFFSDLPQHFTYPTALQDLLYISILAILGSVVAVVGLNTLIHYSSAIFASSVTYIIPVFAILWGFFDGETIVATQIIFALVVFSGIYLLNKHRVT
jgi:drug/metabolite transporter (DMT)-like permease